MKLAHSITLSRSACGKFQTALELVAAERALGVDAALVDPSKIDGSGPVRGVPVESLAWACTADLIVSHEAEAPFANSGIPVLCPLHGQPESNFLMDAGHSGHYAKLIECNHVYAGFVTFWPEHVPYYAPIVGADRLHLVPAPVDLDFWTPGGPAYSWPERKRGKINVVMADRPGPGKSLFHAMSAFVTFLESHPGAKLHVYGHKITQDSMYLPLVHLIGIKGGLGELGGWVDHDKLASIYRAADMVVTETRVASRVVREALACGCQLVAGPGNRHAPYGADPEDIVAFADAMRLALEDRRERKKWWIKSNAKEAAEHFDPADSGRGMIAAAEKAIASASKEPARG